MYQAGGLGIHGLSLDSGEFVISWRGQTNKSFGAEGFNEDLENPVGTGSRLEEGQATLHRRDAGAAFSGLQGMGSAGCRVEEGRQV